jgi:hypothetical protein
MLNMTAVLSPQRNSSGLHTFGIAFVIMLTANVCAEYVLSAGYVLDGGSGTGLAIDHTRTVVCAPGYSGNGASGIVTCLADASWDGPALVCAGKLRFSIVNRDNLDIYNMKLHTSIGPIFGIIKIFCIYIFQCQLLEFSQAMYY